MAELLPVDNTGTTEDDVEFISLARQRFTEAQDADAPDRTLAEADVKFVAGDQWDLLSRKIRDAFFRPVMVWNRLHKFVDQVCNDGRQNNPAIQVTAGDGGDPRTAQVKAGRVRQIEYESDADIAYDTSREQQVISGRGFYRITTEWETGPAWRQCIRLEPIENQFSVLYDPLAKKYDRSDAGYMFVWSLMSKDGYKREYGDDTPLAASDFAEADGMEGWVNIGEDGKHVRVVEYWVKEYRKRTKCLLHNGDSAWKDELPTGAVIKQERTDWDWTVVQYIIDGSSILKRTEWLGKNFPIVPLWGRQEVVDGKRRNVSLVRYAHDAQKLVNLYVSNIAEAIGQQPKTPYIAFEGTLDGHEKDWAEVNNIPKAFLYVKPVFQNGALLPPPQRVVNEPPIQALVMGLNGAIDALKAACGIYDASLGAAPPDASGLAMQRRNTESDTGNYHFSDNEARSRKYAGRVILELIKELDANQDSITVRGVDGKTSSVKLRKAVKHSDGSTVVHNLDQGSYEPNISTGPSYTSARQAAESFFSTLANSDKNFMQIGGDVLFQNSDMPGADILADRYKKLLPPQLQDAGDPAVLKGKLTQATQMIQGLTATVHKLQDAIDAKLPELQTRLAIAQEAEITKRQNIQAQVTIAEANLGVKSAIAQLQSETGAIQHSIDTATSQQESEFDQIMNHYAAMGAQMQQDQANDPSASGDDSGASGDGSGSAQ